MASEITELTASVQELKESAAAASNHLHWMRRIATEEQAESIATSADKFELQAKEALDECLLEIQSMPCGYGYCQLS